MLERLASIRSGIGENMEDRYLFKAKDLITESGCKDIM